MQGNKKELNFFKVITNREQASGLRSIILCIIGLAIFLILYISTKNINFKEENQMKRWSKRFKADLKQSKHIQWNITQS